MEIDLTERVVYRRDGQCITEEVTKHHRTDSQIADDHRRDCQQDQRHRDDPG